MLFSKGQVLTYCVFTFAEKLMVQEQQETRGGEQHTMKWRGEEETKSITGL